MGSEFIEKAAPTFKKSWDRARVDLATATLFTKTPASTARTATADILCNALPEIGENLIVPAPRSGAHCKAGQYGRSKNHSPCAGSPRGGQCLLRDRQRDCRTGLPHSTGRGYFPMLTKSEVRVRTNARNKIMQMPPNPRHLWHDPDRNIDSLGCRTCPEFAVCGGLRPRIPFFDCLQFCCGNPPNCDRVCRNNPSFVDRVREVENIQFTKLCHVPHDSLHQLYHPLFRLSITVRSRLTPMSSKTVALPLYKMFDRRTGAIRYSSRAALASAFGLAHNTNVLLTGTDRDRPLERWWALGENPRLSVIRAMKQAGILLATTPNYSLFIDRPRWDDLHAMKRIVIVHEEFLRLGLPAALHVNGRTEDDFRRWADFVGPRKEITHLAYEFTTGTGLGRPATIATLIGWRNSPPPSDAHFTLSCAVGSE